MDFSDLVAQKIIELMDEKQYNISRLAKESGMYRSTLSQFLNRTNKTIRLENLVYICDALQIKLSVFFSDKRFDSAEATEYRNKK